MASLFWVGGSSTWNATAGTKWATTSGGAGGAAAPTAADDVFLDASSGAVTVTISAASCRSLDCTGFTGTLSHSAAITMQIGTSTPGPGNVALKLVAGMTYTLGNSTSSAISFVSTSATQQTIDWGGRTTGNITFGGAGGSWQYISAHALNATAGTVTLSLGTLDLNGQTCTWGGGFVSTSGSTRSLIMGAAAITITLAGSGAWTVTSPGMSVSAGTSTITMSPTSGSNNFLGGGFTYNNLVLNTSQGTFTISGANTFNNFSYTGEIHKTDLLQFSANQTITGTLTLNGNSAVNRILVQSDVLGTPRTITAANVVASNVDFQDIVGAGASSWNLSAISGGSGDCLGNSGIIFTTPTTQTATGTASFTWSTHGWTSRVPLPQDSVVVNNAFIAGRTVTMDMPRPGKDIDFSGATGAPTISTSLQCNVYGSLSFGSGQVSGGGNGFQFAGRSSHTITSNGFVISGSASFTAFGGTYQLQDNLATTASMSLNNGTLDCNNKNVTPGSSFNSAVTTTRALTMGTGTWTFVTTGAFWNVSASGMTMSAASSTIVISAASASARSFAGAGFTYGTLTYTVAGSTGSLSISGANTFSTINFSDASNVRTLSLPPSVTTTITTALNVTGTAGLLMTLNSSTSGTAATISKTSGLVQLDYVSLKDSTATGGAVFYAGRHSTSVSGNTGWKFPITAAAGGGNWSATGTWTGGVVPTAADDVLLASTSGSVTIDSAAVCRSLDCTGYTGTLTHNTAVTLSIGTSSTDGLGLVLVAGMTYTLGNSQTSAISFVGTSATAATINTGGKTTGNFSFAGVGGAWKYVAAHTNITTTLSNGALDLNGQTFTWNNFVCTSGSTRSLTMGSAAVTLSGNSTSWNVTSTGMTVSGGTSTVTMTSNSASFVGGGFTYGGLVFTAASANGQSITGANTFTSLSVTGPAGKTHSLLLSADQTITGTLTLNGNSAINRLLVASNITGTARTLTAATVVASYLDLADITGAGAGSWNMSAITGLAGDATGNSGITFTIPATQTWQGTSTGSWSDVTKWTSRIPLPQDNVVIASAFASHTITADMPRLGKGVDFTGTTGTVTWTLSSATGCQVFGSVKLVAAVTSAGTSALLLDGRGSYTLTSAGVQFVNNLQVDAFGGTYALADDCVTTGQVSLNSGTLDLAGHSMTSTLLDASSTQTRAITFGAGTWNLTQTSAGSIWNVASTGMTMSAASGTIAVTTTSTNTRTFTGGGVTYGALTYNVSGSTGQLSVLDGNTFDTINFSDVSNARTLQFQASTTTTILTAFNVNGTAGKLMSIVSSSSGTAATLSKASGTVGSDYLSIKDSTATGGAGWYAGTHSTNVSGNTGWNFLAAPVIVTNNQSAVARISNAKASQQPAVSRIAVVATKNQAAVSRIAQAVNKVQTAVSRIAELFTKTQSAIGRIANTSTKTQSAVGRIASIVAKSQSAVSRIATGRSIAQTATARTAMTNASAQTSISRVSNTETSVQTATANIHPAVVSTNTQNATSRIAIIATAIQDAVAAIVIDRFASQTSTADIAVVQTSVQTATAFIDIEGAKAINVTARVAKSVAATQIATATIRTQARAVQSATAFVVAVTARTLPATASISSVDVDEGGTIDAKVSKSIAWTVKVSSP